MTAPVTDPILRPSSRTDSLDDWNGSDVETLGSPASRFALSAPHRLLDSGPALALATVLGASVLAIAVATSVATGMGRAHVPTAPAAYRPIVVSQGPDTGDSRHGSTGDADARRTSTVVIDGPGAGDSRHGLWADSATRR